MEKTKQTNKVQTKEGWGLELTLLGYGNYWNLEYGLDLEIQIITFNPFIGFTFSMFKCEFIKLLRLSSDPLSVQELNFLFWTIYLGDNFAQM